MELSNFEQEDHMTEAEKVKEQRIPINTVVNSLYYGSLTNICIFKIYLTD